MRHGFCLRSHRAPLRAFLSSGVRHLQARHPVMINRLKYYVFVCRKWIVLLLPRKLRHLFHDPRREVALCKCCNKFVSGTHLHLGFSNLMALYCSRCEGVLLDEYGDIETSDLPERQKLPKGDYGKSDMAYWIKYGDLFKPCPCGGTFDYLNSPRCPKCKGLLFGDLFKDKPALKEQNGYVFMSGPSFRAKEMIKDSELKRLSKQAL